MKPSNDLPDFKLIKWTENKYITFILQKDILLNLFKLF